MVSNHRVAPNGCDTTTHARNNEKSEDDNGRILEATESTCTSSCECRENTHGTEPLSNDPQTVAAIDKVDPVKALSWLDRFLWLWILLAMVVGVVLGYFVPDISSVLDQSRFIGVSAPIAVGLMVMMYPILCKVQYEKLHRSLSLRRIWTQLLFSFIVNWIFAPLLMVGLAWAFLPDQRDLREGLILVGVARCIAMVLIWTGLAGGDDDYCAILVAFNSILQIVLYAPFAILYISKFVPAHSASERFDVQYSTVAASVGVFLGIPLAASILTRLVLRRTLGAKKYDEKFIRWIGPWSLVGLLFTTIILFASQGKHVVEEIVAVVRVAAPLVVYFIITFSTTLWSCRKCHFTYPVSVAQSFTASSNNFELAIAVAIATYGIDSRQALAATVGPLIEIPVLLALVYVFKFLRKKLVWTNDDDDEPSRRDMVVKAKSAEKRAEEEIEKVRVHGNDLV